MPRWESADSRAEVWLKSSVWSRMSKRPLRFSFLFFQAEDGIRGLYVTGVQTCALPISGAFDKTISENRDRMQVLFNHGKDPQIGERRVGKECRSRWSPYHSKKKSI